MFVSVNVCVYVEGLRRSFATPNPFVLTNKICLNQPIDFDGYLTYQTLNNAMLSLVTS